MPLGIVAAIGVPSCQASKPLSYLEGPQPAKSGHSGSSTSGGRRRRSMIGRRHAASQISGLSTKSVRSLCIPCRLSARLLRETRCVNGLLKSCARFSRLSPRSDNRRFLAHWRASPEIRNRSPSSHVYQSEYTGCVRSSGIRPDHLRRKPMQIPTRSLSVLILVLVAACGTSSHPTDMPASSGGGIIQGSVIGSGSQMLVEVPSSSAATTTDANGGFLLATVPKGATVLHFSGGGQNASLATAPVVSGEFRHLTLSISGTRVTEQSEQTETEFEGTVDAIDGMVLTVAGRKVAVTDATTIRKDDAAATFADLVLGTLVEVEGTLNADGGVTAIEISIEDRNEAERIAFVVTLTQIAGNTLTVDGVTVHVGSATVIVKGDTTLTLPDLKVGDRVLVRGAVQADKSINATRIRVLPREDEPEEEMHVSGKVTAVGASSFTIGDTLIATDAKTEFEGSGFHGLADLKVGDFAFAEVIRQADGSLLAEEVKKFTPPPS